MKLESNSIQSGQPIDARYAFGASGGYGGNVSPQLRWSGAPEATRSFVLLCVDPDVPTDPALVNQDDRSIPRQHERCDFFHWVMVDIPAGLNELAEGECGSAVVEGGKAEPPGPTGARQGLNDYTGFMAGSDLAGMYHGYDGPCPPWNDDRLHHYHFRLYALDVEGLELGDEFDGRKVEEAIQGHVLDQAEIMGTYSLNPKVA